MKQAEHLRYRLTDRARHVMFSQQEYQENEWKERHRIGADEKSGRGSENGGVFEELRREREEEKTVERLNQEEGEIGELEVTGIANRG